MRRLLCALCLVVGCGPGATGPAGGGPGTAAALTAAAKDGDPAEGLTDDQRTAWMKLRRNHPGPSCFVLGFVTTENAWRNHYYDWTEAKPSHWTERLGEEFRGSEFDKQTVTEQGAYFAKQVASEPRVKVAAVVDIFGDDGPKVLQWFVDGGKGAKELKAAPTPELDASLKTYLHGLQTRADQL